VDFSQVVLWIAENLLTLYATDPQVKLFLDNVEFHVIPIVNVDGYTFSWTSTRLWRKNRRPNAGGSFGVDTNRNFEGPFWCEFGASKTPSSETFCGAAPFSEPETQAVSTYIKSNGPFLGFIDYHSFSQLVMRPFGYQQTPAPPTEAALKVVGDGYSATIRNSSGKIYVSQSGWQLYLTTGGVRDWNYNAAGTTWPYTVELRPDENAQNGFILPPAEIRPTGSENWDAFKWWVNRIVFG